MVSTNHFLTILELASYLGIKPKTLYAKIKEIPHYKVGRLVRFRREEIDAWMEQHRVAKTDEVQSPPEPDSEPAPKPPRVRKSRKRRGSATDMRQMARNTIDQVTAEYYSSGHGKSDQVKGSGKEV